MYGGILFVVAAASVSYIFISNPNIEELDKKIEAKTNDGEVAYPETYDSLVAEELKNNISFLKDDAIRCEVWNNKFPYQSEKLDLQKTKDIIVIINDTSNYRWDETGTSEFDKTIIYFNKIDEEIGYTIVSSEDREAKSYPHRAITKWGSLSHKGYKELMAALQKIPLSYCLF